MKFSAIAYIISFLMATMCYVNAVDDHGDDHHDDQWCHGHDESIDAFDAVKTYLNVTTSGLRHADVSKLIEMTMFRLGCDTQEGNFMNNVTCSKCLTADNIYKVLGLNTTDDLDEASFHRAATIITVFSYQLVAKCSSPPNWANVTYDDFLEELMHFEEHDHDEHDEDHPDENKEDHDEETHDHEEENHDEEEEGKMFDIHQVEELLAEVNMAYRPGPYGILMPDKDAICANEDQDNFRARDIISTTDPEHEEGIQKSELAKMSAHIIARILHGFCIKSDRAATDNLPDEDDFLRAIYSQFDEEESCALDLHGLEGIMSLLSIGGVEHGDEHGDEHADDHGHDHRRKRDVTSDVTNNVVHYREKRAVNDTEHDHDHGSENALLPNVLQLCMTPQDLLRTFYMNAENVSVSRDDFVRLCPALLQQSIQGCRNVEEHDDEHTEPGTSIAERYGYGTLAAFLVSVTSVFGLCVGKSRDKPSYEYVMSVMMGLAMGSLVGDSLLHLVPHGLALHVHDHSHAHVAEGPIEVEEFVWKMIAACGSVWLFLLMEMGLTAALSNIRSGRSDEMPSNDRYTTSENGGTHNMHSHDNKTYEEDDDFPSKRDLSREELAKPANTTQNQGNAGVAWMITIGDAVHNLADGLAMGAAFSQDWRSGISTSLAIFVHEIPHEFGDIAVLLTSGWSITKVALAQVGSALTCFIGLYIGLSISENPVVREWIYIATAGMFLYIALSDVIPEIMKIFRAHRSKGLIFICANSGILVGFVILALIAIYEERIAI